MEVYLCRARQDRERLINVLYSPKPKFSCLDRVDQLLPEREVTGVRFGDDHPLVTAEPLEFTEPLEALNLLVDPTDRLDPPTDV